MLSCRLLASLSLAAGVLAAPLAAQPTSTIEIGGTLGYTFFDSDVPLDDKFTGGGFLAFFIIPRLSVEGEFLYTATGLGGAENIAFMPIRGRLVYSQPLSERAQLFIGSGFVQNLYRVDVEAADFGFSGLLGLRLALVGDLAFRLAGTADYITDPSYGGTENLNYGVQAGLSFRFGPLAGGGGPAPTFVADLDGDGVTDDFDACPRTGRGERVDSRGCAVASDADGDGVLDDDDRCPDTPADVAVDATGCAVPAEAPPVEVPPADADSDGVPDAGDSCPNTVAGARVDARGCAVRIDSDGDGVPDADDACPDTPAGAVIDARGCPPPLDADGDGVVDSVDDCPGTASGARVDQRGCAVPLDSDGDGIADAEDACPNTIAGVRVDSRGCAIPLDSDGDGIADVDDACPGTSPGVTVDARGCAPPPPPPTPERTGGRELFAGGSNREILEGVSFAGGETYELTPAARRALDEVAEWLMAHPDVVVEIASHTDNRAWALIRSQGRASAVRQHLIDRGVSGARLQAKGHGAAQPAAGGARNNRIELRRIN